MAQLRVILNGKIVGSVPQICFDGGQALHIRLDSGEPGVFCYDCWWIDENNDPVGSMMDSCTRPIIPWRMEIFLNARDEAGLEFLSKVEGWESVKPKRIIDLPFIG